MTKRHAKPASERREQAMLLELQERHGYALSTLKPSERTGLCFSIDKNTLTPVRFVKLAVPATSALGKALAANDKADRKAAPEARSMKGRR